jgi:HTH-type transcriptional regulator, sugar sensing transcriptional regulator
MTLISELVLLGLTDGEARVYLSLLKLGSSKVGAIVRNSHVSYSKVYDVLERLGSKGLVSHITIGEIKYFNSVEPYRLHDYIQSKEKKLRSQKEIINKIIPDLAHIATKNREGNSSAEIFVGDRGLRTAYEILFKDAARGDILRYFYPYDDYHETASPFYSRLYLFQRSKGLEERAISSLKFKQSNHYKEVPKDVNMRFVPFPLPGTMDLLGHKLLIISWTNIITGILITSKEISEHFRNYFDSIWNIARKK